MRNVLYFFLIIGLFNVHTTFAQQDTITLLEEVFLTDKKLKEFSTGQTVLRINDTLVKRSRPLLTSVLNYNTHIYFKENGLGMVSSPSFRGTTASQTAVLWNGININSQFNGQTDFNTINAAGYDDIAVRGGGGSVVYGTGAVGGTIHLNTKLSFREKLENDVFVQYGSFNTLDARYRLKAARKNWTLSVAAARNSSDNDYELPNGRGENINGQFYNNSLNIGAAYRINDNNTLNFYSELFEGERHFSLIRPSETKSKYQDLNSRNLLEWESNFNQFTSSTKLAYLDEQYKFFGNIASENYSFGRAKSIIGIHDLKYSIPQKFQLNSVLTNTYTNGEGSNLGENIRNIFSAALLLKHQASEHFDYEAGIRTEITDNYESPFLFSAGASYQFSEIYSVKFNTSRNFRIPTYNDLYWSNAGNTYLQAETSLQGELGQQVSINDFTLSLTGYYIDISNMIRWLPGSDGVWRPRNEQEVTTYGVESFLNWRKEFGNIGALNLRGTYAHTVSKNDITGMQLTYVPYNKSTAAVNYTLNRWNLEYQFLYTGEVFTRSDNDPRYNLDSYMISNVDLSYATGKNKNYIAGTRVLNLFDKAYESVENRWMPGINFNIYLNLNF